MATTAIELNPTEQKFLLAAIREYASNHYLDETGMGPMEPIPNDRYINAAAVDLHRRIREMPETTG